MTERPILYSAPMVRAVRAYTKTQTRRVVKGTALEWLVCLAFSPEFTAAPENGLCPYGQPGDLLWVRETFFAFGRWETRYSAKKGRDEWHFVDMTVECGKAYAYAADDAPEDFKKSPRRSSMTPAWWKRPAIFMPRAASRITLEITGVRIERLQDISEADAHAEGVIECDGLLDEVKLCDRAKLLGIPATECRVWFAELWESINGPDPWAANPWVWVLEFKRVEAATGSKP